LLFSGLISLLSTGQAQSTVSPAVETLAVDLLDANHILHFLSIVDAFGHVSARNPDNSSEFLMTFSIAPALATSQTIVTYEIDNATAVQLTFNSSVTGNSVPSGFVERFIHSEIYKAFPDVQGVVHSHTNEVLPFAGARVPLTAQMHTSGSIGTNGTAIFDVDTLPPSVLPDDQPHDLLIRNEVLGDALAQTFSNDSQVVLMRGHGMAVRGASLRDAVFRSFYTKQAATVQLQSIQLGGSAASVLTPREAIDAANTTEANLGRGWDLWVAQVDNAGLYVNDLRSNSSST